jgi:hypothetical protein
MKYAYTREDIARALNFGTYPVLTIDLADCDEYGLVGSPCRIDFGSFSDGEKWYETAELRVYRDERKLSFHAWGSCLSESYTYSDFEEQAKFAVAPIVEPNSEFVVAVHDSKARELYAVLIVETKRVNKHCSTPLGVEDVDMSRYVTLANKRYRAWKEVE